MPAKRKDHLGKRFGKLTVLEQASNQGKRTMVSCICDCGCSFVTRQDSVLAGKTQSCGCLQTETVRLCNTKHGKCEARLYKTWTAMLQRCNNHKNPNHKRYGARGINVCEDWGNFVAFQEWALTSGYNDDLQIDRIDNNGNYSPENCRWVTRDKNQLNKRNNRLITVNGKTQTLTEWAKETGLTVKCLANRIDRGWDEARAVSVKQ